MKSSLPGSQSSPRGSESPRQEKILVKYEHPESLSTEDLSKDQHFLQMIQDIKRKMPQSGAARQEALVSLGFHFLERAKFLITLNESKIAMQALEEFFNRFNDTNLEAVNLIVHLRETKKIFSQIRGMSFYYQCQAKLFLADNQFEKSYRSFIRLIQLYRQGLEFKKEYLHILGSKKKEFSDNTPEYKALNKILHAVNQQQDPDEEKAKDEKVKSKMADLVFKQLLKETAPSRSILSPKPKSNTAEKSSKHLDPIQRPVEIEMKLSVPRVLSPMQSLLNLKEEDIQSPDAQKINSLLSQVLLADSAEEYFEQLCFSGLFEKLFSKEILQDAYLKTLFSESLDSIDSRPEFEGLDDIYAYFSLMQALSRVKAETPLRLMQDRTNSQEKYDAVSKYLDALYYQACEFRLQNPFLAEISAKDVAAFCQKIMGALNHHPLTKPWRSMEYALSQIYTDTVEALNGQSIKPVSSQSLHGQSPHLLLSAKGLDQREESDPVLLSATSLKMSFNQGD